MVFAPTISALLQLALSRTREFDADLGAARLTSDPRGLATALAKMEKMQSGAFEQVLMPGRRVPEPSLLRTHPPTEERVQRLLQFADAFDEPPAPQPLLDHTTLPGQPRRPRWHLGGTWY